jgi:hypothetical protein
MFYPVSPTKNGSFWTFEQWLEYQEKDNRVLERGQPEGARPPTPEELIEMRSRRMGSADA